ncbi:MAG: ABC transporter ATP-binding protein [Tateyamaria sp.]|jgi:iron complex transport system ATP-binding protein|nr:ABC transporter ATP-binding protein [Tateyamaria sp.]MBT5302067.1 ABC transporter ATP-binding protein [Tateyamaria sp.]MBT6266490.1 ABC transporter ATP-binding protein [Tateyamaria sp.]MBT6342070.1 ABC transporter ATP-binding protein [Tateyamaria sp.]MBT7447995.1 ABC transporter ATP-binding protein [Tateyamaria sp.]
MSAASLNVENVSWTLGNGHLPILNPTSFVVDAGQVLGVVGPNGAGKSTLLRMLYRYQSPVSGRIWINGEDIWAMSPRIAAQRVAAVLQEQPSAFGLTVREIIALGRTPHHRGFSSVSSFDAEIIDDVINSLNLHGLAHRDLVSLSGGERQRVMIARALVQKPQVLILDEPTNHLDIRNQLEIIALVRNLDLTIIVSLHDLNVAADICDVILMLDRGHAVGFGPAQKVLTESEVSKTFRVDARLEHLSISDTKHFSYHLPDLRQNL